MVRFTMYFRSLRSFARFQFDVLRMPDGDVRVSASEWIRDRAAVHGELIISAGDCFGSFDY